MKSPFFVVQEFLSPLQCEDIVDMLEMYVPDVNTNDDPIKTIKHHNLSEKIIFERFEDHIDNIEQRYDIEYRGTEKMSFEWYPEGCDGEAPHCENSNYVRKKWLKTKDNDFTAVLFLSDYQTKVPFDSDYEVYGGKLEFPQHNFGFNPERGTLVIFPSGPHFLNNTTEILAGDLYQVRFHFASVKPFLYDPNNFPGDYREWLREFA